MLDGARILYEQNVSFMFMLTVFYKRKSLNKSNVDFFGRQSFSLFESFGQLVKKKKKHAKP